MLDRVADVEFRQVSRTDLSSPLQCEFPLAAVGLYRSVFRLFSDAV